MVMLLFYVPKKIKTLQSLEMKDKVKNRNFMKSQKVQKCRQILQESLRFERDLVWA